MEDKPPGKFQLVDLVPDKLLASTVSKAELPDVFEQVQDHYLLDNVGMLGYARRRYRRNALLKRLEKNKVEDVDVSARGYHW